MMLDLALIGLDDRTIDLAGAHGDAGEADFVQAADRVDIATVLAADEDFELRRAFLGFVKKHGFANLPKTLTDILV